MRHTRSLAVLLLTCAAPVGAAELPAGTPLSVRLTTRVSSRDSRAGDAVEAVLIAPVEHAGRLALAAGATVRGTVCEAGKRKGRASLRLDFSELIGEDGRARPITARVLELEDSRESVAEDGRIVGIKPRRPVLSGPLAFLVAIVHPVAAAVFEVGRQATRIVERSAIDYPAGAEMTLGLTTPLAVDAWQPPEPQGPPEPSLSAIVQALPFRTQSASRKRDIDVTNLLIVGSRPQVESAFAEAGWTPARSMGVRARVRGLLALLVRDGYSRAAVSPHELMGRPPDLVFQKQHNTLAKRHHVRIWQCGESPAGEGVWVGAGTHDVAIVFDRKARAFTHRIDPEIDGEREKIVNDLRFTGQVAAASLVDRPDAPRLDGSAPGDRIATDGRVAVIVLRPALDALPLSGVLAAEMTRPE